MDEDRGHRKTLAVDLIESDVFITGLNTFNRHYVLTNEVVVDVVVVENDEPEKSQLRHRYVELKALVVNRVITGHSSGSGLSTVCRHTEQLDHDIWVDRSGFAGGAARPRQLLTTNDLESYA